MAKKSAQSGEFMILVEDEGNIVVLQDFSNTIGAMREIAEKHEIVYDPKWTTRQFGNAIFKEYGGNEGYDNLAILGEYTVQRFETGSFKVLRKYDNTKGALREIAEANGFEYDKNWTTRQFGNKLVDFINSK